MIYLALTLIGIMSLSYINTFVWLIESWLNNPYYSHGFLVPIISGYIIWNMRKELNTIDRKKSETGLNTIDRKKSETGLILFIIGLTLNGIGILYTIRFLSGLSLIVTIFGVILYLFGIEFTKKISFPILFLILMVPVPFIDIVAPSTQTISTIGSVNIANLLGVPVHRDGLLLEMPSGTIFEVALECSGLKSVISLLTLSIIYAFILEGRLLMKFTIVISSIPLAIVGNILRVTSMLGIANKYGQDVATNYFHDFSSITLFSIAILGLFIVGRCFGRLRFKKVF